MQFVFLGPHCKESKKPKDSMDGVNCSFLGPKGLGFSVRGWGTGGQYPDARGRVSSECGSKGMAGHLQASHMYLITVRMLRGIKHRYTLQLLNVAAKNPATFPLVLLAF